MTAGVIFVHTCARLCVLVPQDDHRLSGRTMRNRNAKKYIRALEVETIRSSDESSVMFDAPSLAPDHLSDRSDRLSGDIDIDEVP